MRLQDLNWMDVEHYLQNDSRIILVTGATEQHAYLSLMTDVLIPARIADAVADREKVLVAPPLNFGVSQMFAEFPGTISLSKHTFEFALLEIVESLFHQGFRHFFVMNGHSGNELPPRLSDFEQEGDLRVVWYDWWRGQACEDFQQAHGLRREHANWGENFRFTRVGEVPNEDKPPVELDTVDRWRSMRDMIGDGSFGGPYQVAEALMQELFEAVVEEAAGLVRGMKE